MNYGELKAHFQELLNRSDCTDELAETFLKQGFSRLQRDLRIPPMERESEVLASSGSLTSVTLPSDFLEIREVLVDGRPLEKTTLSRLLRMSTSGTPCYYARRGAELEIRPQVSEGSTVEILYYGEFSAMVDDEDENELSVVASDLCLYAALIYAGDWATHEKLADWSSAYQTIKDELTLQALNEEFAGGPMVVQSAYPDCY